MQFGLEIEFRHLMGRPRLAELLNCSIAHNTDYQTTGIWNLGTDGSLSVPKGLSLDKRREKMLMNMYELRSPIMTEVDERLGFLLKTIKDTGGDCSGCCGLHIHFSDNRIRNLTWYDINLLRENFRAKFQKSVRVSRADYCLNLKNVGEWNYKYAPVRRVSLDHIEVRLLNSSFSAFYVKQKIEESKKMIEDFLLTKLKN